MSVYFGWMEMAINAVKNWMEAIGQALGFPFWEALVVFTMLSIILAYLVIPAVGSGSDKTGSKGKK